MSADKIPTIVESALSNSNTRTVVTADLAAFATTFPHYHTLFSETFTLLAGSMAILTSPDQTVESFRPHHLSIGESLTVPPLQLHNFLVGAEGATSKVTFSPGNLDLERAMLIMTGTQREGVYQEHVTQTEENALYMAVMGELANATAVGEVKLGLDRLYAMKRKEIESLKRGLVEKYASEKMMRESVG